jgi:hypothetical protein
MFLIRDIFLPVRLNFLYHCIHWTGAAQILSQALLKVLLEGTQVNLELRIHGLVLNLYTPPVQALFLFLGNRFIDLLRLESLFPFSVSPPLAGRFIDLLMEIQYH